MTRLSDVASLNRRPFKSASLKQTLKKLKGTAEAISLAAVARDAFVEQLDSLDIDRRHSNWVLEWLNDLLQDRRANRWLQRGASSAQAQWNAHVEARREEASKPKAPPLPIKEIPVQSNHKLAISREYKGPTWI